jgi:hypothetical protein
MPQPAPLTCLFKKKLHKQLGKVSTYFLGFQYRVIDCAIMDSSLIFFLYSISLGKGHAENDKANTPPASTPGRYKMTKARSEPMVSWSGSDSKR